MVAHGADIAKIRAMSRQILLAFPWAAAGRIQIAVAAAILAWLPAQSCWPRMAAYAVACAYISEVYSCQVQLAVDGSNHPILRRSANRPAWSIHPTVEVGTVHQPGAHDG